MEDRDVTGACGLLERIPGWHELFQSRLLV
jgi:hypothetical protein